MALKRRRRGRRKFDESAVNITSLLDVLTVLLFFLIKSTTITAALLSPPKEVRLPASVSDYEAENTVSVSLSRSKLFINSDLVTNLRGQHFKASDIGRDGRSISKLQKKLEVENQKRIRPFRNFDPSLIPPGKVLIQADRALPFGTMKYLLHTVAVSGYSNYQFVVIGKDK